MRALGACMFVARNLRPSFYKTFKASICASTARRLFAEPSPERCEQISQAISEYLEELESESPTGFSLVYLGRVYPGNPHQGGMFLAALFQIPLGRAMDCFKATREGYCSLTSGLSYETVDAIAEITDEPGGPQDDCQQPPA